MKRLGRRRRGFATRVEIERRVLGPINDVVSDCPPLNGLTQQAVRTWLPGASQTSCLPEKELGDLIEVVMRLPERMRTLGDGSGQTFYADSSVRLKAVDAELTRIETLCN